MKERCIVIPAIKKNAVIPDQLVKKLAGVTLVERAINTARSVLPGDDIMVLTDSQETLLVGLLDDASATLVLDLVRSCGGRVLAVEHHRVDGAAADWAQALGRSLASSQVMNTTTAAAGKEARVSFSCVI